MIKALLFDYGGTLDTAARHWSYVLHDGYTHAGVKLDQETFRTAYVYAERALARSPYVVPTDDFLDLLRKKVALEVEQLTAVGAWQPAGIDDAARLVDEVALWCDAYARREVERSARVLQQLAAHYKLVVVSNFYGNLATILRAYGIAPYFDALIESAVVGVRKPDPAIWAIGVKATGFAPDECAAIGDSYGKDILPARSLGCETVWFEGEEWEPKDYDRSVPTHIIHNLSQLTELY